MVGNTGNSTCAFVTAKSCMHAGYGVSKRSSLSSSPSGATTPYATVGDANPSAW